MIGAFRSSVWLALIEGFPSTFDSLAQSRGILDVGGAVSRVR